MRDARDIERAMAAFGDAVWRACLLYLPPSEAEDAFQEAFLKYALHDGPFEGDEHARSWLLRVAMNGCKDVLRRAGRANESLDELVERGLEPQARAGDATAPRAHADPELSLEAREALAALDALGDPPKTQLYLALVEGYSAPEISRMLGMPEGTVYSWISRGRRRLREVLS